MSVVLLPSRWRRQPQCPVELDLSHPLTQGLIYAGMLTGPDAGTQLRNYCTQSRATMTGTSWASADDTLAMKFNGTSDFAQHVLDLSPWPVVTVSFWLWWDAFGTDNKCAISYHTETASYNGMFLNCNPLANKSQWVLSAPAGKYQTERFDCPTAAAWHHWSASFDRSRTNTQIRSIYIDAELVTNRATISNTIITATTWENSSMLVGKAVSGGTSFWAAGRMRNLMVHNRQLTQQDTKALYREPWGMVRPLRSRIYSLPVAAAGGSSFRYYMAT
jgi:hypothetical protein